MGKDERGRKKERGIDSEEEKGYEERENREISGGEEK